MFVGLFERYRLHAREARFVRFALLLSLGLNLLAWGIALWFVVPRLATSPFFALHYSVYFGVDRIGPPWGLLRTPLLGLALFAANLAITFRLYRTERLAAAFFMALTLLLEGLILVLTFLSILLNL
ncbi:MAG: hypothetical protein WC866_03235 [Patescibacteria group bacterium]|jgi:hypothetical protein